MGHNLVLTVCALFLFGTFVLAARDIMATNARIADRSEYSLTAISLAQSIIDEAKTKAFDHRTVNRWLAVPTDSLSSSLGVDGFSEALSLPDSSSSGAYLSLSRFNDVDDYNQYVRVINTARASGYAMFVEVKYVNEDDPESESYTPTYLKRMNVTVTSPSISQLNTLSSMDVLPIRLSYFFAY
jgi:hypothetical protein